MSSLHILSGGAAQGLVNQLRGKFYNETGRSIEGSFGAVGLMRDQLLAGTPCDVLILTQALIDELTANGHVLAGSARPLGTVRTGVAVKTGEAQPQVDTPEALKAALLAASGIYFPDPVKATAGIHFMNVLKQLGIDAVLGPRLRPFPNGATAMKEMAAATEPGLIGCTQVTEILYTPGVQLVAPLPKAFELATVYVTAMAAKAEQPQAAAMLIDMLASPAAAEVRRVGGFE
ncbi:MAG: molybdate ABC transporter substrate-binding protein [Curvibacter sp. GWA2_64_110]|nr:MAG: molybdate ABC transporter substrate-binding protein [Curvibacter sp. GWA2_64_110]HCY16709.1 molybdate ABC transporter substrate-binding protein [Curvibacter sp.]